MGTRQIGGRLVSVFEPSWPSSAIDRTLTGQRWGWDQLGLYWGELLGEGVEPGDGDNLWLRMSPTNLPRVEVRTLGADVQYSSHVVNIVLPGFGEGYVNDEYGFDIARVTSKFYQSLPTPTTASRWSPSNTTSPTTRPFTGTYLMEVFLFWPGSGTQFSRAALSPIVVD